MSHGYLKFLIAMLTVTCLLSVSTRAVITINVYVSGNGKDLVNVFAIDDCFEGPHASGSCQTDSSGHCSIPNIKDLGTNPSDQCNYMKITPSKTGCTFNPEMSRILYSPGGITANFQASCCTDGCTPGGARQCSGTTAYQTCGNYDADPCLEWGSPVNCPQGQTCQNTQCSDITPPAVSVSHSPLSPDSNDFVVLTATASDGTGVKEIRVYVDDVLNKTCTFTAPPASGSCSTDQAKYPPGQHSYYAAASDPSNNQGRDPPSSPQTKSFTVQQETTPPSIWVNANPPSANATWQKASATASVSCSDTGGSGCNPASYRIYISDSQVSSCPNDYSQYTLPSPQIITSHVWVCSAGKDLAGNTNFSYPMDIKVDQIVPTSSIGTLPQWTNQTSFNVSWSGTDEGGSGMSYFGIRYRNDSGGWADWLATQNLNATFTGIDNHTYSFSVNATDAAGNSGQYSNPASTTVDTDLPNCTFRGVPAFQASVDFWLNWSGMDNASGIQYFEVQGNESGTWQYVTGGYATKAGGVIVHGNESGQYFRCRTADNANNTGPWSPPVFTKVDVSPPEINISYPAIVSSAMNVTISTVIKDANGVESAVMRYNGTALTPSRQDENPGFWNVTWVLSVPFTPGSYSFTIEVNDTNGNNYSQTYAINVTYCMPGDVQEGCLCGTGTKTCSSGGTWGQCMNATKTPANETCNGEDDDCNGIVDDVDGGDSINSPACGCYGNASGAKTEVCNGIDDNCNGQIDDNAGCCTDGSVQDCGQGICAGTKTCTGGIWGPCDGGRPARETCGNGKDDDCDGTVDNGCEVPCHDEDGDGYGNESSSLCAHAGADCNDSDPNIHPSAEEVCNGKDDNCDGQSDEGLNCETCNNEIQDGNEEGVDCGGDCPACFQWGWLFLTAGGVVILLILLVVWLHFRRQGRELTWEELKKKWTQ